MDAIATSWSDDFDRAVLVVDDEAQTMQTVVRMLRRLGFRCQGAADAHRALEALDGDSFGVVVVDIRMPRHDGLWFLERLRERHPQVASIVLTGHAELGSAVECLRKGATDYLSKPVRLGELEQAVERAVAHHRQMCGLSLRDRHLANRVAEAVPETGVRDEELVWSYVRVRQTYDQTLEALCSALDAREKQTGDHSRRVARVTLAMAQELGYPEAELEHLGRAALLHDIGKIGVPDRILLKKSALDAHEWEIMRRHPVIGHDILAKIPFLQRAAVIVLSHHEHFDGSGYPFGLTGGAIPQGARIFAVADTLDAMTSRRPYRSAVHVADAIAEIDRCAGGQFDPAVVDALLRVDLGELLGISSTDLATGSRRGRE